MNAPPILAHGALGIFDELIFFGVAAAFVVIMGVSWARARRQEPEAVEAAEPPSSAERRDPDQESSDRFRLD